MKNPSVLVIIPAFNEAQVIGGTVRGIRRVLGKRATIFVVDDGSTDTTRFVARRAGAMVVHHPVNRGLGGALGTGLYWAKTHDVPVAVTFDADGQHDARDLLSILRPIDKGIADVVIGTRTIRGWKDIPLDRKIIIVGSNLLTWWLFGVRTSDSLSGFRAFNRQAIEQIQLRTDRMEVSNEFFFEMKRNRLRLSEVPIRVIYSDYSRRKGQKNSNIFDVTMNLLLRLLRS